MDHTSKRGKWEARLSDALLPGTAATSQARPPEQLGCTRPAAQAQPRAPQKPDNPPHPGHAGLVGQRNTRAHRPFGAGPQLRSLRPRSSDHRGRSHYMASKARAWPSWIQPASFDLQPWNIRAMALPVVSLSHKQDQGLGSISSGERFAFPSLGSSCCQGADPLEEIRPPGEADPLVSPSSMKACWFPAVTG